MKNDRTTQLLVERIQTKKRRKWYYTGSVTMAAIIVFCTVYALILPAITLENKQLHMAPYGAVLEANAQTVDTKDLQAFFMANQEKNDLTALSGEEAVDWGQHLLLAQILIGDKVYDGSYPIDKKAGFQIKIQAEISENAPAYQYKFPPQMHIADTGSENDPLILMAGDQQIGTYYIQDDILYLNYDQSYTDVTTEFVFSANWVDDVKDSEKIDWGNDLSTDVTFANDDIDIVKQDDNNGVMHKAEDGSLWVEYTVQAAVKENGTLSVTDSFSDNSNGITKLWKGCYNGDDYQMTIRSLNDGSVVSTSSGTFSDSTNTSFTISNIELTEGQYAEIKYKVRVDETDRENLDVHMKQLQVSNEAEAKSDPASGNRPVSASVTHKVTYQSSEPWLQKSKDNSGGDSNDDDSWTVSINPTHEYDMQGTVMADYISSEGTTYITDGDRAFHVEITGENGIKKEMPLKVIDIANWTYTTKSGNTFNYSDLAAFIGSDLAICQTIDAMNAMLNNAEVQEIFQKLLGVSDTVDAALLSQYAFVDNSSNPYPALDGINGPLFMCIAPPDTLSEAQTGVSGPYSYDFHYKTKSNDQSAAVVNSALANWRGIFGGTGPVTTLNQQLNIAKRNDGVYTGADGGLYVDWYVDVTMPANSAALKNVWLLDYLPQANVTVGGTEYETLPYLVGLTSNSLDGEFLMAHEKEFGKYFTPDKNSELFQYLHGLVEGNGNGVFTITGNGLDENSAAAAAGNAYALLCAPSINLKQNFNIYAGNAAKLGTMELTGYEDGTAASPRAFSIWFESLPATTDGYTVTVKYTTKVNPHTMPLATQDYVEGINTVEAYSTLDKDNYTKLGQARSSYWLSKQKAEDSVTKNIINYDRDKRILTYQVDLNPLNNLDVAWLGYVLHDSLSNYPGAVYLENSFKLYAHADFTTGAASYWNYDSNANLLIYAKDPNAIGADPISQMLYEYLNKAQDVKIPEGETVPITPLVLTVHNNPTGSSNFVLNLNNIGWLSTSESKFLPMTLEYQVQLPVNPVEGSRFIDNEVLFSAHEITNPEINALIGADRASFDAQDILHKTLSQMPNQHNNYTAGFQVVVNRSDKEQELYAKTEFTLMDELSSTLQLDISTIKLQGRDSRSSEWTDVPIGNWRASLEEDENGNKFYVTIYTDPNKVVVGDDSYRIFNYYRLTYQAKVVGNPGTDVRYSNKVSIQGTDISGEPINETVFFREDSESSTVTNLNANVLKVDGNDLSKCLPGVKFVLHSYENGAWTQQSPSVELITDENGRISLTNATNGISLKYNTWYCLEEVMPLDGYLKSDPVYFYIEKSGNPVPNNPERGVNGEAFSSGIKLQHEGTLTVLNRKPYFNIIKQDADTGQRIEKNVGFTLYKDPGCSEIVQVFENSSTGRFIFDGLQFNKTYYLKETKTPPGYKVTNTVYEVKIDENGNVTITGDENVISSSDGDRVFIVKNTSTHSFELPATGGIGATIYTLGGILLMAIPLVYGYRKKRRCERRAE